MNAPSNPTEEKPTINSTLLIPIHSRGEGLIIIEKVMDIQNEEGIINPA